MRWLRDPEALLTALCGLFLLVSFFGVHPWIPYIAVALGAPFAIGNQTSIASPGAGMLWLAVNDDGLGDNSGEFGVDVTAQARRRR